MASWKSKVARPISVYVKTIGGWAFLGQSAESLKTLPSDPLKILDGLDKQYDIAVRAYVQNIPEMYRKLAIDQINSGVMAGSRSRLQGEDDDEFALRKKMVQNQVKALTMLINDTDTLTMGWSIDPQKEKNTFIDFSLTALPGTKMSKQFADVSSMKSDFAGFLVPDAAITLNVATKIAPEDADQVVASLKTVRTKVMAELDKDATLDAGGKTAVKEAVGELMDAVLATFESGKIDGGAALLLQPKSLQFVAGAYVADGAALEGSIKKLVKLAQSDPNFPGEVKFDVETYKGIHFHQINVPLPDPQAAAVFGEKLNVFVGMGPKTPTWPSARIA